MPALRHWGPYLPHLPWRSVQPWPSLASSLTCPLQLCRRPVPGSQTTTSRPGSETVVGQVPASPQTPAATQLAEPSGNHPHPARSRGHSPATWAPSPPPPPGWLQPAIQRGHRSCTFSGKPRPDQAWHFVPQCQCPGPECVHFRSCSPTPWATIKCISQAWPRQLCASYDPHQALPL